MKKFLALTLITALCLSLLAGCKPKTTTDPGAEAAPGKSDVTSDNAATTDDKVIVGIAMPTKEQPIWASYGKRLVEAFGAAGYDTVLEFAEDDTSRQIMQIENMITKGAKYLVISAVDGYALTDVCDKAAAAGIKVIAGDRLLMNTTNVDYYVTFDLIRMGEIQGEYIESALGLKEGKGPFNLEIFSGSPDDPNSVPFYEGAMNILKPYLDSGKLVCKSGQVDLAVNGTLKWDSAAAQSRMDNILSAYYSNDRVDAVIGAADCLSMGIISSLSSMGYGTAELPFPIVVGQDCELTAVKYILEGKQSMSVFLDAIIFSDKVFGLVNSLENGETITPDATYNNDAKEVETILYDPVLVDKNNYHILIERGFYTEEDLK